jgi:hypothetical protein
MFQITSDEKLEEVKAYQTEASKKSDLERTDLAKGKTGVFTKNRIRSCCEDFYFFIIIFDIKRNSSPF